MRSVLSSPSHKDEGNGHLQAVGQQPTPFRPIVACLGHLASSHTQRSVSATLEMPQSKSRTSQYRRELVFLTEAGSGFFQLT